MFNVQCLSNILNNNQIIEKKETKNTNPLSNKINENENNTISDTKTEIVKENSQQLVENINNSSKINKKVENFLIKKYKK